MVRRRRYATRGELAAMLAAEGVESAAVEAVLDALVRLGVNVAALGTVVVDEELDPPRGWRPHG